MADETEPTGLATLDLGDIGSESARNHEVAAALFPDDEPDTDTPAPVPVAPARAPEPEPAPEPESPAAPVSDAPGLTKDARGRYHRPDGTVASKEEVEAAKAAAPPAPVAADLSAPPVEPAAAAPTEEAPEPLQWLAYGQPVEIPGAQYKRGHGYFIPEALGPQLRQAWARGQVRYPQIVGENEKLRAALNSTFTQKEAEAHAVIEVLSPYISTPEAFRQFLQDAARSPELALRELKADLRERQVELGKQVSAPDPALLADAPDAGEVAEALTDELEEMFRTPEFTGKFTPAAQRALTDRVFQRAAAFLARENGVLGINRPALWAELQYEATRTGASPQTPRVPPKGSTNTTAAPAAPGREATPPAPPAPPSAVGRSRAVAKPSPAGTPRNKATIPTRSLSETADWLLADD